ncbi:MAG: N-acetylneuraminate synthase family protein [Planctomycetes bacterium]|nr:N-acetylneuraminate synthase family protein [Planctomycetota bacterium]
MKIGGIDLAGKRLLIAELGNNHEGDADVAMKMVEEAAAAGAGAVKVQVIDPIRLVNRSQTQRIEQLTKFRLPMPVLTRMAGRAKKLGMLFIASAFDIQSLEKVAGLIDAVKIASGDVDFHPLLTKAAGLGKPILLSTGMNSLDEIQSALEAIKANLSSPCRLQSHVALLHCVSLYPVLLADANMAMIKTLSDMFSLTVGYSDHTLGIQAAVLSLAMGARIIEKHFTLDKTRQGFRDHALSADPADLKALAEAVAQYDAMMGHGNKELSEAERQMAQAARRSIVAACDLPAGKILGWADLEYVRPRSGLAPSHASGLIGRKLAVALKMHDLILSEHLVAD